MSGTSEDGPTANSLGKAAEGAVGPADTRSATENGDGERNFDSEGTDTANGRPKREATSGTSTQSSGKTDRGGTPDKPARRRLRRVLLSTTSLALVGVLLALVGVIIAFLAFVNDLGLLPRREGEAAPRPGVTASPSLSPTTAAVSPNLFETFAGEIIDPRRWAIDDPSGAFALRDGRFRVAVPTSSNSGGLEATLSARPSRELAGVKLEANLLSTSAPSDGGVYFVVADDELRQRRIIFGPKGGSVSPVAGFESCGPPGCSDYEFLTEYSISLRETYDVLIEQKDSGEILFTLEGLPPFAVSGLGPIKDFRIYVYTDAGGAFEAEIDNVEFFYRS